MQAIVLSKPGDASHLKLDKKYPDPKPKAQEVVIKHGAVGINYFDVAFRKGQYKLPKMPAILGVEGVGIIEEVGSDVTEYKVGERVAYATAGIGSYAEKRAVHKRHLVAVPTNLGDVQVAATLFKGLTAHALLHRVYIAKRSRKILVHAAAGGVGHILTQWAKHLGIEVFGTVGSDNKMDFAKLHGCAHVINYRKNNFVDEIAKITDHHGVGLVYDSVGKDTLDKSLECLWPMGMCVSFGESSGHTEKLDLNHLAANSLYLSRPTMMQYKANRMEFVLSADEVFATLLQGIVKPKITTYALQDVAKAHQDLESRNTTGSLVIKF